MIQIEINRKFHLKDSRGSLPTPKGPAMTEVGMITEKDLMTRRKRQSLNCAHLGFEKYNQ
tara:strand:+ start:1293 stop:1472 length:180 start_codon:yes stop_codon:yes gene_type:complete